MSVTVLLGAESASATGEDVAPALESLLARAKRGEVLSMADVLVTYGDSRSNRNSAQKDNR